ncbi:hypothetical protein ACKE5C_11050 [Aneurinibacillus thermoaerophilus]|uniref:hypothetical protein n=1 Tax=Aneurinibacillus TaxID=55079 RepID=UPI001FEC599B|nr:MULTISPECIES: hypothetical protein [Aneurinibacillus]
MANEPIVQPLLLELLRDDLSNHVASALINVDGQLRAFPIFKTAVHGLKITKYVYLDNTTQGQIQSASLINGEGNTLVHKPVSITKTETGLLIAFEFELQLKVEVGM